MAYFTSSSPERPEQLHVLDSQPSSPYCSRIDDASFLSADVDLSFASISMNSQPATPTEEESFSLHQADSMDISPMPPRTSDRQSKPDASGTKSARPRSKTLGGLGLLRAMSAEERPFGRELSNTRPTSRSPPKAPVTIRNVKASPEASPVPSLFTDPSPSTKPLSARQRAGLPTTWLQPKASATTRSAKRSPGNIFSKSSGLFDSSSPEKAGSADVMDLDSSPRKGGSSAPFITSSPPRPEPASDSDEFGELFFESASPSAPIQNKKRRSQESLHDQENRGVTKGKRSSRENSPQNVTRARPRSSSPPSESPCLPRTLGTSRPFERFNTTGGAGSLLFGQPSGGRKGPIRRPGINPLMPAGESTATAPKSASAGLYGAGRRLPSSFVGAPPARRTMSVQVPMKEVISLAKYNAPTAGDETEPEEESSFDASFCSPVPAKRQAAQRSISYAQAPFAAAPGRSMLAKLQETMVSGAPDDDDVEIPAANDLPGCRDSETHGKILPCFKVKEDGIVRITPGTLENLLRGEYDDHLKAFHIIDCRFDYEFEGGHIEGATNFTTPEEAADYFLDQLSVPPPSSSGDPSVDGELKTVLVFHCEFSAKRGPTFAKHLRAQDRKRCHEAYPRVHYPEVYILQGGYKSFWESHPHRCGGYTEMDDPNHVEARREKIDTMRKWERTRSYTYGERTAAITALGNKAAASAPEGLPQRLTSGDSTSSLSKAASGAPRRAAVALSTLVEHHEADTSFGNADSDCSFTGGVGDSPCPAIMTKKTSATTARSLPARRAPLGRASTLGPLVFSLKA